MNTLPTKTRFAPSPTGFIHIGNVRTALLSALFSAKDRGIFLLRIEDTDLARSQSEYVQALIEDLAWLGITYQEGPDYQSERQAIYQDHYDKLIKQERAYPCFCSEAELTLQRKLQLAAGKPPRYAGTCAHLSAQEIAAKEASGLKANLRFGMGDEVICFTDLVKGEQRYSAQDMGDFIIRRADGMPTFMFCNAIDDSLMGVTHVIRGEDHLTNTPRQLAILTALDLRQPQYGHISLIFGSDGTPLSKRNGSRSVRELREAGYLPLGIVNYLARLGHYYAQNELMSFEKLASFFAASHLSSSPARFDEQQLLHWQKLAIQQLTASVLWSQLDETTRALVPAEKQEAFIALVKPNLVFAHEATHFAKILFEDLIYSEQAQAILQATPTLVFETAIATMKNGTTDFAALTQAVKTAANVKGQALFQPLRVALTGDSHGPEMAGIAAILGTECLIARFEKALQYCQS